MKYGKLGTLLLLAGCAMTLAGCGENRTEAGQTAAAGTEERSFMEEGQETEGAPEGTKQEGTEGEGSAQEETIKSEELLANADLHGNAVSLSGEGCVLKKIQESGDTAMAAASGAEGGEEVNVSYADPCEFFRTVLTPDSDTALLRKTEVSEIEEQSELILSGGFDGEGNFHASRVVIVEYEEG